MNNTIVPTKHLNPLTTIYFMPDTYRFDLGVRLYDRLKSALSADWMAQLLFATTLGCGDDEYEPILS
jgi:hypothetical protein